MMAGNIVDIVGIDGVRAGTRKILERLRRANDQELHDPELNVEKQLIW